MILSSYDIIYLSTFWFYIFLVKKDVFVICFKDIVVKADLSKTPVMQLMTEAYDA